MRLIAGRIGSGQTIRYAFDEFVRCMKRMDPGVFLDGRVYASRDEAREDILWIGLDGSVAPSEDDEIRIDVKNGAGIITGSNERAVLIAVYRLFYELGCRFVRPGAEGELIPEKTIDAEALNVQVAEKASYRHRGVCIEGANTYEHIYDMIDWLPKIGMNGYFVQFHTPYVFFERWYKHANNPLLPEEPLTAEDVDHIWARLEEEVEKRGLMYHATGHGWTCEPFGIKGTGWSTDHSEISPEIKQYFAEVNGKRELWEGVALDTNLCYSTPKVRELMTDAIVDYCKKHPTVDYLHFWLADAYNNQCECPECRKMSPADYYVMMLNELDRKLTRENIPTKVVFLIYVDLLWEPQTCRIENPDRFVLMFAPITRSYTKAFTDFDASEKVELAPYVRNKLVMPKKVSENIARLKRWQMQFDGDSFDFDYHLMWDHMKDPGYYECARILHKDMANLDKIGLNGMVSCQVQRCHFPNSLPMYSMAKALWDKTSDFEAVAEEYFAAVYGGEAVPVRDYLKTLSELFHPPYLRQELPQVDEAAAEKFAEAKAVIEGFEADYIEKYADGNTAWKYLSYHAELNKLLAEMLCQRAQGNQEVAKQLMTQVKDYTNRIELDTGEVFDVHNYWRVLAKITA